MTAIYDDGDDSDDDDVVYVLLCMCSCATDWWKWKPWWQTGVFSQRWMGHGLWPWLWWPLCVSCLPTTRLPVSSSASLPIFSAVFLVYCGISRQHNVVVDIVIVHENKSLEDYRLGCCQVVTIWMFDWLRTGKQVNRLGIEPTPKSPAFHFSGIGKSRGVYPPYVLGASFPPTQDEAPQAPRTRRRRRRGSGAERGGNTPSPAD